MEGKKELWTIFGQIEIVPFISIITGVGVVEGGFLRGGTSLENLKIHLRQICKSLEDPGSRCKVLVRFP